MCEYKKLTEICSPKQWKTISQKDMTQDGYPVYGANGIIGYYNKYNHEKPTVMVTCRGATCGVINISKPFSWINGNAMSLDNVSNDVIEKYLYYYLKNRGLRDVISGSAQPQITIQNLSKIKVLCPNIEEQQRIVNILDKAQEIRTKKKLANEKLDEFLKSTFIDIFGDPVINSKQLPKVKLSDMGTLARGKSKHRPRNAPELLNGPYPLIQTGDVANSGLYLKTYNQTYSEMGLKQSKMWKAGTLCITIAANIAKTSILTFDACFPDSIVGFTNSDKCSIHYIQFWLMFLQAVLEAEAPQSAQKNINLEILNSLELPYPPIEQQNQFAQIVQKVEAQKEKNQKVIEQMDNLFNSLMQQAFNSSL